MGEIEHPSRKDFTNFQISFTIPVDSIPGRMGFLLTLFLCMINILNWMVGYSPTSGGNTTAIIQWILYCSLFIMMAIAEYALILAYKKYRRNPTVCAGDQSSNPQENMKEMSKRLDKWMMVIFPVAFSLFSVTFWLNTLSIAPSIECGQGPQRV